MQLIRKTEYKYNTPKYTIGIILTSCDINKNPIIHVQLKLFCMIFYEIIKS